MADVASLGTRATSPFCFRVLEPENQFDQGFLPQISQMVADFEISHPRRSAGSAGKSYSLFPRRPPVKFIADLVAARPRQGSMPVVRFDQRSDFPDFSIPCFGFRIPSFGFRISIFEFRVSRRSSFAGHGSSLTVSKNFTTLR
jgi:hypothetical protein